MEMNAIRDLTGKIAQQLKHSEYCLAVSHSDYRIAIGGTEKLIQMEEAQLAKLGVSYIHFFAKSIPKLLPETAKKNPIVGVNVDGKPVGDCSLSILARVLAALRAQNVAQPLTFHIHHLLYMEPEAIENFLTAFPLEDVTFFIHDYYSACPQVNLLFNNDVYCRSGFPELRCASCEWGEMRGRREPQIKRLFTASVRRYVAPSEAAKEVWASFYPEFAAKVEVIPHQILQVKESCVMRAPCRDKIRLAYVGYQSDIKGWKTWQKLTRDIDLQRYELFHIGAAGEVLRNVKQIPVSFVEDGHNATIDKLKEWEIDAVLLWSICPETYSFTTVESIAAGCLVLTNPQSGNIARLVRQTEQGIVVESEQALFALLQEAAQLKEKINHKRQENIAVSVCDNSVLAERIAKRSNPAGPRCAYEWDELVAAQADQLDALEREYVIVRQLLHWEKELQDAVRTLEWMQARSVKQRAVQKMKTILSRYPRCKSLLKQVIKRKH